MIEVKLFDVRSSYIEEFIKDFKEVLKQNLKFEKNFKVYEEESKEYLLEPLKPYFNSEEIENLICIKAGENGIQIVYEDSKEITRYEDLIDFIELSKINEEVIEDLIKRIFEVRLRIRELIGKYEGAAQYWNFILEEIIKEQRGES